MHQEEQYLDLIRNILDNGTWEEGRNGRTKSTFGNMMRFSNSDYQKNSMENLSKGTFVVYSRKHGQSDFARTRGSYLGWKYYP
jgi:thymidylate synthase